jgi:hypothetical protein
MPAPFMWVSAMLRKLVQAGIIVALSSAAAYSQPGGTGNTASDPMSLNMAPGGGRHLSPEERQREQEIESKYRDTVNQIPDKKGSNDPWGSVRTAPAKTSSTAKHKQP